VGPTTVGFGTSWQAFTDKPKRWDAWKHRSDFEKHHIGILD